MALLGEALYHDTLLSGDGTVSCATCHGLETGGVDRLPVSTGVKNQRGPINAPTVYNSAHNFVQFWDGRAATLEEQAAGPVENPLEMGDQWPEVVKKVAASESYRPQFDALFDGEVNTATITKAIAEFERTLVTPDSAFDKYLKGDKAALTEKEKRGALLFAESGCTSCHTGSYFGGESYQKLADSYFEARGGEMTEADNGRFNVTGEEADRHMFKVPMLRNIAVTPPYFHDGSAPDLETAVTIMAHHQLGLDLSKEDAAAIVAFLGSLTGEYKGVPLDKMASN
ncbi:cytochrome-c peroxidase [Hyphococcus luteus]|uniref:Cytochrome B6 n=1 Tax=Hyphococcus luteus TaxID=2058213 RepID=A0A2S7K8H1_9PROT|nr:cytochrome c peroxidase [Marinicaulis flavus]PQA88807.1 cytochrome B6 [Marinicaulis flavus]